jgi:hypothetical protein
MVFFIVSVSNASYSTTHVSTALFHNFTKNFNVTYFLLIPITHFSRRNMNTHVQTCHSFEKTDTSSETEAYTG